MIEKLQQVDVTTFDHATLKILKPYFDLNIATCTSEQRRIWFENLFALAQHNLSVAHCVQHNHYPRLHIEVKFKNSSYPDFYDPVYENQIGCYSGWKSADTMRLDDHTVSGTKHWISLVDRADFGLFRIPVKDTEAYVLIDFTEINPSIDTSWTTPIGMQLARPGSITIDNYTLPEHCILGYRKYHENNLEFFHLSNMLDYSFITNYVGLIVALYKDLEIYVQNNKINIEYNLDRLGLRISSLFMTWQDNLSSTDIDTPSNEFWHRRNTQYTLSKDILLDLIGLILQIGDSRWVDAVNPNNQRFRDALTFSSHMKPLQKNLQEKQFVIL
jgi:hypothetical protein